MDKLMYAQEYNSLLFLLLLLILCVRYIAILIFHQTERSKQEKRHAKQTQKIYIFYIYVYSVHTLRINNNMYVSVYVIRFLLCFLPYYDIPHHQFICIAKIALYVCTTEELDVDTC